MKMLTILLICAVMSGCNTMSKDQMYYDTAKSISKDSTVSQTACWTAIAEIAKNGDNSAKVGAIALAEKCKNQPVIIESPKKNWLGL